ncbi:ER membrane protein complex subunit 4-like [Panonychus citri]|uniref:ER membrane protein complex subunit 4-like n=1 Tax=Panonychus citri TaxID=50023 RepID=UPI00230721EA|nr:ER membrane protein complex subunit 4-like [Panonychus citri]
MSSVSSNPQVRHGTNGQTSVKRHKFALNFNSRVKNEKNELGSPPGFVSNVLFNVPVVEQSDGALIVKKSWDIALGPVRQLPMNLFIMYMAGNSISIFPIMMVGMLFLKPVKALLQINTTFKLIEGNQSILQKFIYLLGNILCLALALYKCQSMGLLPIHPSDWLDFVEPQPRIEFSGGTLSH